MAIGYKKEYILQIVLQNPGEVQAEFWVSVCIMHAKSYFMKFTVILSMTPVVDFEAGAVIRDLKSSRGLLCDERFKFRFLGIGF